MSPDLRGFRQPSTKAAIRDETGLTASAGVSYNNFLAKLASDHRKPNGLFVVTPGMGYRFVEDLPVGKFHGVGPVTAALMERLGIHTGLDLRQRSRQELATHFGKNADYLYGVARGIDDRLVAADRIRKSVGAENTFERDLLGWNEAEVAVATISAKVWDACVRGGHVGRTVTTKVKYSDFSQVTRRQTLPGAVRTRADLERSALDLLRPLFPPRLAIRLLGVTVSNLASDAAPPREAAQLALGLPS